MCGAGEEARLSAPSVSIPLQTGGVQIPFVSNAEHSCLFFVLGQSVVLPQPAVVQLQTPGVLPASQPVIAVAGGTPQLHNPTVNALPPAAGNGSTSGKIPATKPLLQSTPSPGGLDVSSGCVIIAWELFSVACMWDVMGEPAHFRVAGRQSCNWAHLIGFLTVNREFGSLAKDGEKQLGIC